jgi:hypothetical protein
VPCRQVRALAREQHVQDAVTLLAQCESHGVRGTIDGKATARPRVPHVAARPQLFVIRLRALMPRCRARSGPSRAQGKPSRKRPVRLQSSLRHEIRTGHNSSRSSDLNANCTGVVSLYPPRTLALFPSGGARLQAWRRSSTMFVRFSR